MKKLVLSTGLAVCAAASTSAFAGGDCGGVHELTQDLNNLHPFYYNGGDEAKTTDSGIPHLPAVHGHMQTNNTYRFFNVNEMVATMVGEGKHGLWRTQDNGTVREYIEQGAGGIHPSADILNPDGATLALLQSDYSHLTSHANFGGYVADGNQVNDNGTPGDPSDDYLNYVDLPISHAKYDAKADGGYDNHVPIDLPGWYCTMSGPEYENAQAAVRFAFAQPGANQVGPLGERAGLDIRENYLNVLRLDHFPDARSWVNTSEDRDVIDYEQIDTKRNAVEYYLVERPFFNEEYLFIIAVFDDTAKFGRNFSYIRPDGPYYDHLMEREINGEELPFFNTKIRKVLPQFRILEEQGDGSLKRKRGRSTPTNLYGVHHPGGMTIANGACPAVGGDFGASYYGGSWPNTYQEISPLCDAVMVDIKFWANLDGAAWNTKGKYLANATIDGAQNSGDQDNDGNPLTRGHTDVPGVYGAFADPYLVNNGVENLEQFTATGTQSKTYETSQDAVSHEEPLPFTPSVP